MSFVPQRNVPVSTQAFAFKGVKPGLDNMIYGILVNVREKP